MDDADGKPVTERALGFAHELGGEFIGEEETRLGVPLIPDRAGARSLQARLRVDDPTALVELPLAVQVVAIISMAIIAAATVAGWVPVPAAFAIALLVPAAAIDVEQRRLPDVWVGAAMLALVLALALSAAAGEDVDVFGAIGAALVMALPLVALHLASPAAMGFGDVKAAVVLGAAVGTVDWRLGFVALALAALLGAAVGVVARRRSIPFGPFLVAGSFVALVAHDPIATHLFAGGPR